jgi:pyrroloquinoline quinone biosynthesis protein E
VIQEAGVLGVLQIGFSGGEPLQRKDLESLVRSARDNGLYTNLITSGLGLTQSRARQLAESGLDNIQLSFQAVEGELADRIAGVRNAHEQKLRAADLIQGSGIALSLNVVVHRFNIDRVEQIIDFAEKLGATRLELANTQYYGWGRTYITVNPNGFALPCPTAGEIPGLPFDNVLERSLAWIWTASESFNRFRGTEWMPDPCRSCPQRMFDFGGCRCQAALLTGDPANTDPACEFSSHHLLVRKPVEHRGDQPAIEGLIFRVNPRK